MRMPKKMKGQRIKIIQKMSSKNKVYDDELNDEVEDSHDETKNIEDTSESNLRAKRHHEHHEHNDEHMQEGWVPYNHGNY